MVYKTKYVRFTFSLALVIYLKLGFIIIPEYFRQDSVSRLSWHYLLSNVVLQGRVTKLNNIFPNVLPAIVPGIFRGKDAQQNSLYSYKYINTHAKILQILLDRKCDYRYVQLPNLVVLPKYWTTTPIAIGNFYFLAMGGLKRICRILKPQCVLRESSSKICPDIFRTFPRNL